jgi:hypothetical protein
MKMMPRLQATMVVWALSAVSGFSHGAAGSEQKLAADFWQWRARTGQYTAGDVARMERPPGVVRDWSALGVQIQRTELTSFEDRWRALGDPRAPIAQQVDHRLLGAALARVRWELDILKRWERDPGFYVEQTLTPVGEALTVPGPYDEQRSREILARLNAIPAILQEAKRNLLRAPAPLARMAVDSLADIRPRLQKLAGTLSPQTTLPAREWQASAERAALCLERYRAWLQKILPTLPEQPAIGRDLYVWFLRNVALMPYTPEQLLSQAEQEWRRAAAFAAIEENRNRAVPPLVIPVSTQEFVARNQKAEAAVRDFLQRKGILTLSPGQQHFTLRAVPPYLAALGDFVELDDLTSPARLNQNGIRYVVAPSADGDFFRVAAEKDPRIQIVLEGTAGLYGQLCASWKNPDPIRRHYYDLGANEGIGSYSEEMMLQSGLYDDSPHSREIVYNQMRLRALRVIADVNLALGVFTSLQAAGFLQHNVPMGAEDALREVVQMGAAPGQKISDQIGKLQIVRMLDDARIKQGAKFSMRSFHDYVWSNGNVPVALQRWEYLGLEDEVNELSELK